MNEQRIVFEVERLNENEIFIHCKVGELGDCVTEILEGESYSQVVMQEYDLHGDCIQIVVDKGKKYKVVNHPTVADFKEAGFE